MTKPTAEEMERIRAEALEVWAELDAIAIEQGLTIAEYLVQEAKKLKDANS